MRLCVPGIAAALLHSAISFAAVPADTVYVNGAVYTVDATRSWATAVAVTGDRISYVGNDKTARTFVGRRTRVVDLRGRMLLPGFQDSHVHPGLAPNPATRLDLQGLADREQILSRIKAYAVTHSARPWIVGTGWEESAFLPSGQPSREMLDAILPEIPVFLTNNSQHMGWANSAALVAAKITRDTPDPANGRIERDTAGVPTGVLQEAAMDLVRTVIPPPTLDEQVEDLAAAVREMHRVGITAFEDALVPADADRVYLAMDRRHALDMRTTLCLQFDPAADDDSQIHRLVMRRAAFSHSHVRANCVKIVLDGAYGSHTVALLQPYSDEPAKFGNGKLFVEPQRLARVVTRLDSEGFQVHIHAIGDGAVRAALDAFAAARRVNGPADARHTIAHLALIDQADLPRFRSLNVIANMTPLWSRGDPWETVFAPKIFGVERSRHLYLARSLLDSGAVLVWGSDWPVTGVAPVEGIETAVTHRFPGGRDPSGAEDQAWIPEERVTLEQALVAYTAAGAYLVHDETDRGSIEVGKLADLVVLSRNLFEGPPLAIHDATVDMTIVGGKVVFERN